MNAPPIAEKQDHPITVHGHTRNDVYFWMRLSEEQRTAAEPDSHTARVIAHLNAENAYCNSQLEHLTPLRTRLFKEMRARIKETDMSVPVRDHGYWYSLRFEEGREYAIHQRRKDHPEAPTEVMIDENVLAQGHEFFDLGDLEVSPSGRICAYGVDTVGRRQYELRFRDLGTGEDLADTIPNTNGGGAWADDRTFFYAIKDATLRSHKIMRHVLGTAADADVEVFHEPDPAFSCDVHRSRSDAYVIISSGSTLSNEYRLLRADRPLDPFRVAFPREEKHEFSLEHVPGKFLLITNWNARNFRLMECPEHATAKADWSEVIPHRDDVMLEDVEPFKDHMVITERKDGLVHLRVRRLSDGAEHAIPFNDPAYVAYGGSNPEFESTLFRYGYTSLTTPSSVFEHDMVSGSNTLLKQQEVLGTFDPANYASERIWAPARDGARIPVSIVRHKDTHTDGTAPILIYGYGSYGLSLDPTFSSTRLGLLDRGFAYAIAHVRGGEELGRAWYEGGRMEHKQNTFNDLIDATEELLRGGYGDRGLTFCMGGSAGGLLVGAATNMRPDLWKAVVAEVPFVDVVTTMLDESIPLTTGEFDEWGDPKDKDAYFRMLSYSPYDNVKDAVYPAMLVLTGFHDSQVQYWEPAKWVQRLREHQRGSAPILLHTNMDAGHGGASGRFERLKEVALIHAFLLDQAGAA